jgi:DNA replication protein DnaC
VRRGSDEPAISYERVREHLGALSMEAALSCLDVVLEQGQKQQRCTVEILDDLLGKERSVRFERRIQTNLRLSGITHPKTLESFDFDAQPQVPREVIAELATLRFVHSGENVLILILGPPGVGKSHLAAELTLKAIALGHRVYFLTHLVTKSRIARSKNRQDGLIHVLTRPALLVLESFSWVVTNPEGMKPVRAP